MRPSRVSLCLFCALLFVTLTFAQDSEDSPAPKRVLKKYRVRRPVVVDDQGNVVRAGPRLRRVRVKNPRPTGETKVTSTSSSSSSSSTVTPPSPPPQPQLLRQRTLGASPNAIPQERRVQPQIIQQQQPAYAYEDQGVAVEQIRTVPTFRQATTLKNREALLANVNYKPSRGTSSDGEDRKIGTTRNYSRINEDGSFTFGYEAEDGSFKEETRGVDCVVRGKYGYIDPEGVRREFEYVSGNPCDPNDPNKEEEEEEEEDAGLAPNRPVLRQRVRPTELSENNIQQGQHQTLEERLPEDQLATFRANQQQPQRQRIRTGVVRQRVRLTTPSPQPTFSAEPEEDQPAYIVRQRQFPAFPSARPSLFQEPSQSLEDRPSSGGRFNFDDEINRLARPHNQPQPLYEQPFRQVVHQPSSNGRQIFGNANFHRENAQPTPSSAPTQTPSSFGRYRTELVYDQNSGQYTNVLVQPNQNSNQDFQLSQKIRAYDPTPSPSPSTPSSHNFSPAPTFSAPTSSGAYTQIQQFGQPQIQYYHQSAPPQGRSVQPQHHQDPSQINQFLARHAYQQQQPQQSQQQSTTDSLNFIPPHLRPTSHQTAEIQRQEVREIDFPSRQGFSANSAASSNGQIDAFLRALNISI